MRVFLLFALISFFARFTSAATEESEGAWRNLGREVDALSTRCWRDSGCYRTGVTRQFCPSMSSECDPCGVVISESQRAAFSKLQKESEALVRGPYRECRMSKCMPSTCKVSCKGFSCVGLRVTGEG